MSSGRAGRWIAVATMTTALAGVSCAYFNTLYNANKMYKDAQKSESQQVQSQLQSQVVDPEDIGSAPMRTSAPAPATANVGQNAPIYEQVIEKCTRVIAQYPDSRHVDDAMLLIGKSLFALQRYDEAVSAFDSLTSHYPKTNLRADAEFLKGKSLVKAERYDAAVTVLNGYVDQYRKSDYRPEAFYLLCTSLMQLGLSENAVTALHRLEKDHGRSEYRYRTQSEMARILAEKGLYKESLAVYQRLAESRVPSSMRFEVWMGMGRAQVEVGDFDGALATLDKLRAMAVTPDREPRVYLLRARAFAGADSTTRAIAAYTSVVTRFGRGIYGAEANFRLGELFEGMDSLKAAQAYYQAVPKAYSSSEFAEEAIKRSGDIGRVLRLQESQGDDSPEAIVLRTFSMAEIQLFQFNNTDKAIPSYEKIITEYPQSEFAAKSAYALGYIYGVVLQDSAKAREWYDVLRSRYPESEQTQLAYAFYKGAPPPPPLPELMRYASPKTRPVTVPQSPGGGQGANVVPVVAAPDSTGSAPVDTTRAPADTTRAPAPVPAPVDTSTAPADSTGGN